MSSIAQRVNGIPSVPLGEMANIYKIPQIRNLSDYMDLPEINQPYEIINGEMIMSPAPNLRHQWIERSLSVVLHEHVSTNNLGNVFWAPFDIKIPTTKFRTRQPDVFFISKKRSGFTDQKSVIGIQLLEVAPELVGEILSPSDRPKVVKEKLADYQKIGVSECWLIEAVASLWATPRLMDRCGGVPDSDTVKVLKLSKDKIEEIGIFGIGEKVRSEVLPGLDLSVDEIFA